MDKDGPGDFDGSICRTAIARGSMDAWDSPICTTDLECADYR